MKYLQDLAPPCLLDAADPRHAALYRDLYTSPEVMRAIASPLSMAEADDAFRRMCGHNGRSSPGHRTWVIESQSGARALGITGLIRTGDEAEFGLMLLPHAWNGEVSRYAVAWVFEQAFSALSLRQVHVRCRLGATARVAAWLLRPHAARAAAPTDTQSVWIIEADAWRRRNSNGRV